MAVTLPSDLIADVMRNADPSRLNEAKARLSDIGSKRFSEEFQNVLTDVGEKQAYPVSAASLSEPRISTSLPPVLPGRMNKASDMEAHVAFERMVLRNLLESLLPDAGSGTFGTGPSAGIWRSLAADQLAGLYAGSGGIGIAATLSDATDKSSTNDEPEWPYFSRDRIEAFTG
jgi:peptidoglycan hydrolase FlgJ